MRVVTDDSDVVVRQAHALQNARLQNIRILVLVDEHVIVEAGDLCGEYAASRLKSAINLPRGVIEFKIADNPLLARKDTPILLYCKTGGRSALAVVNLQRMGYTSLTSVAGGIDDWVKAGRAVVSDEAR